MRQSNHGQDDKENKVMMQNKMESLIKLKHFTGIPFTIWKLDPLNNGAIFRFLGKPKLSENKMTIDSRDEQQLIIEHRFLELYNQFKDLDLASDDFMKAMDQSDYHARKRLNQAIENALN